jgi:ribosomal protection tetracycline resistance protein
MEALARASTQVYEPYQSFELEIPIDCFGVALSKIRSFGTVIERYDESKVRVIIFGDIPAANTQAFLNVLPGISHGQGVWSACPGSDRPVSGLIPVRPRTDGNPLNREEYLLHIS